MYRNLIATLMLLALSNIALADHTVEHTQKGMLQDDTLYHPDNTKNNIVDSNRETVLPENQSNKKEFLERTANIRNEIVKNEELSVTAQNIKIVTLDTGTVVLRGPVKSEAERKKIEAIVNKYAAKDEVVSFLEIAN